MADVPFLGCKISLISKCDIRYEGILYCVDAKESTIALSKVKSYGTESRGDPSNYVAPKNDIYDIIIFRASDVKDLRVDTPEPPGLSDPAIISAHHSYPGQAPSTSSFNTASTNNLNNATNNSGVPMLNSNGSLSSSGPSSNQQQKHQQHQMQQKPLLPFLPTGSNKSQSHQDSQPQHQQQNTQHSLPINYSSAVANAQRRTRPEPRENRRPDDSKKSQHDLVNQRDTRRDDRRNDKKDDRRTEDRRNDDRRNDDRRNDDRRNDRRDDRRVGGGGGHDRRDHDVGRRGGDNRSNPRLSRGGYESNNRNRVHSNSRYNGNNYSSRRGADNRDDNSKGGGSFRRGPMQGGRRARSGERTGAPRGPRKTAPLKFDGEYDFDEANKLFLELEGKFKSMKIKNGDEKDGESSGEGVNSKSPTGQSESGSSYDSEDQNKDGDSKDGCGESVTGEYYDKSKSFFDKISCEASERSQGKVNKPDWRKERQLNAETFGVSAHYRRGGYRGRPYAANGFRRRT